jgi:N-acetyl-anhydromuramyl-L-alanine amidase AmpD
MRAYSKRHYGLNTFKLKAPHVIVEHVAEASSIQSIWNTFAPDHPDPEFGELPNVCAHFGVSKHGRIYKFVTPAWQCRHTVGLNYTAVGIEHVGFSDNQILSNREQMRGSLRLTRYLRCRLGIKLKNVIGHNESLSSPYFRERVRRFRNQTHGDWTHAHMERYRARLAKLSC